MSRTSRLLVVVATVVAVVFGGWIVYATVINDPAAELTAADLDERLASTTTAATASTAAAGTTAPTPATMVRDGVEGKWLIGAGSEVGYRVAETLGGVATEGVGRTDQVEGGITIAGRTITAADFTVDVASIASDSDRRDEQFAGRIMQTDQYPTATFVLSEPIDLGAIPAAGAQITVTATGDLTLRGVTRATAFDLTARVENGRIGVLAKIPIVFADFGIANPSFGPVQTEDVGLLEVLLLLDPA
jgi:polyisoprenoid-binding protein YceI